MDTVCAQQVEMIPIDSITVINPRVRNRKQHQEIIENIRAIGLKKPITVSRRGVREGVQQYDLVCGQGVSSPGIRTAISRVFWQT